jgi:hypothetical protein
MESLCKLGKVFQSLCSFHSAEVDSQSTTLKEILSSLSQCQSNLQAYSFCFVLFFKGGPTPRRDLETWRKTNVGVI